MDRHIWGANGSHITLHASESFWRVNDLPQIAKKAHALIRGKNWQREFDKERILVDVRLKRFFHDRRPKA